MRIQDIKTTAGLPWLLAGLVGGAVVTLSLIGRTPEAPPAPAPAGAGGAANADAAPRAAALGVASGPRLPAMDEDERQMTMTAAERAAERDKQLRSLEAAFAADTQDPATGAAVEGKFRDTLTSDAMIATGIAPKGVSYECRTRSCRVVATFDKPGDAEDWALFYPTAVGGDTVSQVHSLFQRTPGGDTEARIYLTRVR